MHEQVTKPKHANVQKRRYITGFDGLRALGVIGVIFYHLNPYVFKGGYLGVPIFLVLSGYLITDSFLREWHNTKQLNLKNFFVRRMKRLYPALVTMLLATCAYIWLFQRNLLHNLKMIVFSNLTYWYNWWEIAHGQSYFDRFSGNASPFTHLWTLSIEGQFYLIWPFIMLFFLMIVKNRKHIFNITILLTVLSTVWMAFLYQPNVDPSRVYYGTGTRAFSILIGCALAFVWPMSRLSKKAGASVKHTLNLIGLIGMVGMIWLIFTMNDEGFFVYHGGMLLFSIFVAMVIAVVAHPASSWNRWLTNPIFSWLGKRSYGIYIYQFPVMIFFEDKFRNVANHPILYPTIEIILILVISEISYRFIEQPMAHFDYRQSWQFIKNLFSTHSKMGFKRWSTYALMLIFAAGICGIIEAPAQRTDAAAHSKFAQTLDKNSAANQKHNAAVLAADKQAKALSAKAAKNKSMSLSLSMSQSKALSQAAKDHPVNTDYEKYGLSQLQLQRAQNMQITAVGDSVLLAGSSSLQQLFPKMYIQAKEGRKLSDAIPLFQQLANSGNLAPIVLVCLGTNGPITDDQVNQVMKIIGSNRHVFWLTAHVPTRSWQNSVNATLAASAKRYKNLTLIDWNSYSSSHPDWFWNDEVHPREPNGTQEFGAYIAKNILDDTK